MKRSELLETDTNYKLYRDHLNFLRAAYHGAKNLVEWGLLDDFEDSALRSEGKYYGFGYSKRIVNTVTDFIREVPFEEKFNKFSDDQAWQHFLKDCDLYGTNWNIWWGKQRRKVSYLGWCGVLVDMASVSGNPAQLAERGIYPYLSYYSPLAILERKWDRDPVTNRPYLSRLKLLQDSPKAVQLWTPDSMETWILPEKETEEPTLDENRSGENPLGEIPFVAFINIENTEQPLFGISDIEEIAAIDASIIVDSVRCGELLKKTSFPMLALPKEEDNPNNTEKIIRIGHSVILDIDPEKPNAKPFWLQPEAAAAIAPMLDLWDRKKTEIYEIANLSGIVSASKSREARSADSFQQLFRFLNANLAAKIDNEIEARLNVIRFWLKFWGKTEFFEDISITHSKKFDVDKFISVIDDVLTGKTILKNSRTAQNELDKRVARRILTDLNDETQAIIDSELENSLPADINIGTEEAEDA